MYKIFCDLLEVGWSRVSNTHRYVCLYRKILFVQDLKWLMLVSQLVLGVGYTPTCVIVQDLVRLLLVCQLSCDYTVFRCLMDMLRHCCTEKGEQCCGHRYRISCSLSVFVSIFPCEADCFFVFLFCFTKHELWRIFAFNFSSFFFFLWWGRTCYFLVSEM